MIVHLFFSTSGIISIGYPERGIHEQERIDKNQFIEDRMEIRGNAAEIHLYGGPLLSSWNPVAVWLHLAVFSISLTFVTDLLEFGLHRFPPMDKEGPNAACSVGVQGYPRV